ncbi:sensor histidine kinase [Bailinhaonella thermotolerans]|uniref:histidine kinase n=1 Tax=Bailinhaonella thermotolerans TaxID=1070861 RepID=A0A3A4BN18_9ACTN|nr:HAMP domain-containing sensor histidine kinase [Bailinhaonella thermotolerans]RJL32464.1 sensor histidine kinase [Bailinhaonella thermotolerans]
MRRMGLALARVPLWGRLIAGTLVLVTAALTVTGLVGTQLLHNYLMERLDLQLEQAAHKVVHNLTKQVQPRNLGAYVIHIVDDRGRVVNRVPDDVPDPPGLTLPAMARHTVLERGGRPFTVPGRNTSPWRVMAMDLRDGRSLVIATSQAEVEDTAAQLLFIDLLAGGGVLLGLGAAGYLLVRASLRPLAEMEATAEAIAAGDLSRRVPDHPASTEVGRLGRSLNAMLARLEAAIHDREASEAAARASEERMRRFVADASHELRTPLTSIRGYAELSRRAPQDAPELPKLLARIEEEAARMGLLVDDLLLLARLDMQRPLERRPVDLFSLAADTVVDARTRAPERTIDLVRLDAASDTTRPVVVSGDEPRLRQVLDNLVNNALVHTPSGTPVEVRVGTRGDEAVVEVADEGPGVPADQAAQVFERFYRAGNARSASGIGLGLSIVSALATAHHGVAELDNRPGEGATFRIRLPLDGQEAARAGT